jgi:murein DD-endopeptidase MepM/ murein hydrolase activator NlpD
VRENAPVTRRRLLTVLLLIGLVLAIGVVLLPHPLTVLRLVLAPQPRSLPVPVQGVTAGALVDSWGAPRSGGREHRGIDIFARRGTPVLSPVSGVVLDVGQNRLGGNIVKVLGPGPQVHYFAHLERFGPVEERGLIRRGDVVGYVGDTGNARGTPPHLHYGIYVLPGRAIDPFPILARGS